jgi:hypothetical protein
MIRPTLECPQLHIIGRGVEISNKVKTPHGDRIFSARAAILLLASAAVLPQYNQSAQLGPCFDFRFLKVRGIHEYRGSSLWKELPRLLN